MLMRLGRLNRTAVLLGTVVLLLTALFLPTPFSGLALLLLAAAMTALLVTTWRVQSTPTRAVRVTVLSLLVITALIRIF
jgi:hypothetical protein